MLSYPSSPSIDLLHIYLTNIVLINIDFLRKRRKWSSGEVERSGTRGMISHNEVGRAFDYVRGIDGLNDFCPFPVVSRPLCNEHLTYSFSIISSISYISLFHVKTLRKISVAWK